MHCLIKESPKWLRTELLKLIFFAIKVLQKSVRGKGSMLFERFPVLVPVLMKKRNALDKPAAGLPRIVNYSNTPI